MTRYAHKPTVEGPILGSHQARRPRVPYSVLLLAPVVTLQLWPGACDLVQFDRVAIEAGQVWRLLTCHFAHCNWEHLFWDAAVFAGLGILCERRERTAWAACCGLSSVTIPLAIMACQPEITWYRGLSGIDTALFVWLAVDMAAEPWGRRDWASLTVIGGLLAGLVGKTAYEAFSGGTVFVDSSAAGFTAVPLAHLIGAAVGGLVGLAPCIDRHKGHSVRAELRGPNQSGMGDLRSAVAAGASDPRRAALVRGF